MLRDVKFSDIVVRGLQLADMETSKLADSDETYATANESFGRWYWMVARAEPERFETRFSITADGSDSYDVPDDFSVEMSVEYVPSDSSTPLPLEPVEFQDRHKFGNTSTGGSAQGFRIAETASGGRPQLWLLPAPTSGTYRLIYLPAPRVLTAESVVNGRFGWERWISLDLGIQLLNKEESYEQAGALQIQLEKLEREIELAARKRSLKQSRKIVDVRRGKRRYGVPGTPDPDFWVS